MVRAVVFDMDGLIIDTETPDYVCWKEIYERYGVTITLEEYTCQVGVTRGPFHPAEELVRRCGRPLDSDALNQEHRERYRERVYAEFVPRPGFAALLDSLVEAGIPRAIASTATRKWVLEITGGLGIAAQFQALVSGEDVARGKPHPDVYLAASSALGIHPEECLALEDSAPGIQSAKAAGMRCVAIPNSLTCYQDLTAADHRFDTLESVTLDFLQGL